MNRTNNSLRNMSTALAGQLLVIIVSFVTRMVFVRYLSSQYLGVNGLFTNIIGVLSLAELGIGPAIIFALYTPLAHKDNDKVQALMALYKRAYDIIGLVVFVVGLSITPFLPLIIKGNLKIHNLDFIYLLFIIDSASTYFFSYKRSLIIADQKNYIVSICRYSFVFMKNLLQCIGLVITRDFILYLTTEIAFNLVENFVVAHIANKMYPFITSKSSAKLGKDEYRSIIKNVSGMMFHKLGTIVVGCTDSILISAYVGITSVGVFSNYNLILTALQTITDQFFNSITASVGNLGALESSDTTKRIFDTLQFVCFYVFGFSSICLLILFNPFMNIWVGGQYLFPVSVVIVLVINFYLRGMRRAVFVFRGGLGLYWYDRYKAIFEASINLLASILLVKKFGIGGVFTGTMISTVTTCIWIEPYVLYKYGFNTSVKPFFKTLITHTCVLIVTGLVTWSVALPFSAPTAGNFIIKICVCIIVPNFIFFVIFHRSSEYKYLGNLAKKNATNVINAVKSRRRKLANSNVNG